MVLMLLVLAVAAYLTLQQTATHTETQQEVVDQFEAVSDCQDQAIASGAQADSAEAEIAATRAQLDDCLQELRPR